MRSRQRWETNRFGVIRRQACFVLRKQDCEARPVAGTSGRNKVLLHVGAGRRDRRVDSPRPAARPSGAVASPPRLIPFSCGVVSPIAQNVAFLQTCRPLVALFAPMRLNPCSARVEPQMRGSGRRPRCSEGNFSYRESGVDRQTHADLAHFPRRDLTSPPPSKRWTGRRGRSIVPPLPPFLYPNM